MFNSNDLNCNKYLPVDLGKLKLDIYYSIKKSAVTSTKYRKEGNILYVNKSDDLDTCMQILSLYTKSIACAPENSEELACGYGNRSALLYHMKKFQECIIDIEKALLITVSDTLRDKLSSRKAACLELINASKLDSKKKTSSFGLGKSKKLELPKIIPSKLIPCVSEKLSLKYNDKYGKHLVANKNIKPGEIIAIEEAYVAVPQTTKQYVICSHCLSVSLNGIPCKFCTAAIYCSENCMNQAWVEYHEIECSIIQNLPFFKAPKLFQNLGDFENQFKLAFRFFIKVIKNHGLEKIVQEVKQSDFNIPKDTFSCNEFLSCYNMASDMTNLKTNFVSMMFEELFSKSISSLLLKLKNVLTDTVKSYFGSENEIFAFLKQLLFRFFKISSINAFMFQEVICDRKSHYAEASCACQRGSIITPCCSMFNHSCFPNAFRVTAETKKTIIITNHPIKKGEQLFLNYSLLSSIENVTPKERQKDLQAHYNFICSCPPCSENWPLLNSKIAETRMEPNKFILQRILEEFLKFCESKKMEPRLGVSESSVLKYDKVTLLQVIRMVELYDKYLISCIDGAKDFVIFKRYIHLIFVEFFGIQSIKM